MGKVLMIFVDGVGIGEKNPDKNPFFSHGFRLFDEHLSFYPYLGNETFRNQSEFVFPIDANLGVDGLPQSGTGQTAIFTGINASKHVGKHFGPFPYSTTIEFIKEKSIFREVRKRNKKAYFANAYPKPFFDYINSGKKRLNVTSLAALNAGMRLNNAVDVHKGRGLTAEITNFRWITKLNYKLPEISPELAAKRLLRIANKNDFTLFEYFLTDHLGHWRLKDYFDKIYNIFDDFLFHLFDKRDKDLNIILCSDHGNFEDLSVKTHTRNPALGISAGPDAEHFAKSIIDLTNIKDAILKVI